MAALLKLVLVPLVVWLASVAGRRWGHGIAGWVSGLPVIAAPIMLFVTLGEGVDFGSAASLAILQATPANAVHYVVYAYVSRKHGWAVALLSGWLVFAMLASALIALAPPLAVALALNLSVIYGCLRMLPKVPEQSGPTPIPNVELAVRMLAAFALAAILLYGATLFGPRISGILLTFPISGSVLPAFTRALHGWTAAIGLLGGFLKGLAGFALFFAVLAVVLPGSGTLIGFLAAATASLAITWLVQRIGVFRRARGRR
jgi:hypothetical protein